LKQRSNSTAKFLFFVYTLHDNSTNEYHYAIIVSCSLQPHQHPTKCRGFYKTAPKIAAKTTAPAKPARAPEEAALVDVARGDEVATVALLATVDEATALVATGALTVLREDVTMLDAEEAEDVAGTELLPDGAAGQLLRSWKSLIPV